MGRQVRRWVVLTLAPFGLLCLLATPAQAHAYLVGSNPADGSTTAHAPRELRLSFSEHVVPEATRIEVVGSDGTRTTLHHLRLLTEDATDTEEPATVVAPLPALAEDGYRLSWETLSSDDLHRTAGVLVFGVGRSVTPLGSSATPARPEEVVLRGALLACLALALGGLLACRVLRPTGSDDPDQPLVVRLGLGASWTALVLAMWLFVDQLVVSGAGATAVLLDGYGTRWLVRMAGLSLLTWTWTVRRRTTAAATWAPSHLAAAGGVVLTSLGTSLLGHVGSSSGPVRVLASSVHVAAALTWAGAVVCLAAVLLVERQGGVVALLRTLRAFGLPAAGCLTLAAVTGVFLGSGVVGSVDAALLTTYGRALLVKVLLVAVATGLGLRHHLRVRGPHDLDLPRRGLVLEGGVLLAVLGLTALLASSGTATDPALVRAGAAPSAIVSHQVADLQVSAGLGPNVPGRAVAIVDVFDTRRPAPAPVTGVDLRLGDQAIPLRGLVDGHWSASVSLAAPGAHPLTVVVHRAGLPDTTGRFTWVVGGSAHREVLLSQRPLGPRLLLASGVLALVAGFGWTVVALRLRRRRVLAGQGVGVTGAGSPVSGSSS